MIPYKIIGAVVVISIASYFIYQAGADSVKADQVEAIIEVDKTENRKVREIIKWKEKVKVVYRDRIQKIKVAADPTGCLDTDLRDVGLAGMLKPSNH